VDPDCISISLSAQTKEHVDILIVCTSQSCRC